MREREKIFTEEEGKLGFSTTLVTLGPIKFLKLSNWSRSGLSL